MNSYLVEDAGRITVIDAGLPGLWNDLLAELDAMGRSLGDIRALLLTHGDAAHIQVGDRDRMRLNELPRRRVVDAWNGAMAW